MEIAIVSYFHNAEGYLKRYFDQMSGLQKLIYDRGDYLTLVLGYGDCTDATASELHEETVDLFDANLVDVTHGGKVFGSVVDSQRFRQLAGIVNKLWQELPEDVDIIGFIESDLTWQPESILKLIDGVVSLEDGLSSPTLLAPMVMAPEGRFYDTWAFCLNGRQFRGKYPYHSHMRSAPQYIEMDSVGSCFFMPGDLARQLKWPEEDVVVGLCRDAKSLGAKIILDTQTEVHHS